MSFSDSSNTMQHLQQKLFGFLFLLMFFDVFGRAGGFLSQGNSDIKQAWTPKSVHDPTKTLK